MSNKEIFIETYNKNIHRPGAEKLLAWLEGTDFFTAPASTRFHAAYEGGLLDHSLNVYNVLISKHFNPETDDLESYTIVSLLHDLCKAGFYKTLPGLGQAAAMAIDAMRAPDVVGTLGGDDTVFAVMRDNDSAQKFCTQARDILK